MQVISTLVQGSTLTTAAAVYYTAPTGTYTRVTQMAFCNTDTLAHTFTLYFTPGTSAPGVTDTIIKSKTLQPAETWVPYPAQGWVLSPGGSIQAICDANSVVVIKSSGLESTR